MQHLDSVLSRLKAVVKSGEGFKALCPCHADQGQSLSVRLGDNGSVVMHCFAGCETPDILDKLGLTYKDLASTSEAKPVERVQAIVATTDMRDVVYRAFLDLLTLSSDHHTQLRKRGLTDSAISRLGYKSLGFLETKKAVTQLAKQFGDVLGTIPGFVVKEGKVEATHTSGMLVPVKNVKGYIQGFQVRKDEGASKYVWFAGDGKSLKSPYHVALSQQGGVTDTVILTEGPLKADVIGSFMTKPGFIVGVPGVETWKNAFDEIRSWKPSRLVIAIDADWKAKPNVGKVLFQSMSAFCEAGLPTSIALWDASDGKGLDDVLALGKPVRYEAVTDPKKWWSEYSKQVVDAADDGLDVIVSASTIKPTKLEWVWKGWVPKGCLVILDGDPGQGKSTVACDLAARITTGSDMPDGTRPGVEGKIMFITAEDSDEQVLAPRLIEAGADMTNVLFHRGVREDFGSRLLKFPQDLDRFRRAITSYAPALVVLDPLMAFIDSRVDTHKDQNIRQVLSPISRVLEETGTTMVVIRHLNKGSGSALYRGAGSIGIGGAARAVLLASADPQNGDGHHVLSMVKSNLGKKPSSLVYRLDDGANNDVAKVSWVGESGMSADELVKIGQRPDKEEKRGHRAGHWLQSVLARGPMSASDIERKGEQAGFSYRTLESVKTAAGVESFQKGDGNGGRQHYWRLKSEQEGKGQGVS